MLERFRTASLLAAGLALGVAPVRAQDDAGVPAIEPPAEEEESTDTPEQDDGAIPEQEVEPEARPEPEGQPDGAGDDLSALLGGEASDEEESAPSGPYRCRRNENAEGVVDISQISLSELLRGDVTLSYSRSAERIDDAPASVTVIPRQQLLLWGYQSLAEALEHVVGFYPIDDHIMPNVAVRGISGGLRAESGLLKVMIDGRPISFRPTGGNWLGPELIPMSAVERIEIIRGPTSTVYGADAFLGVINVITRAGDRVCGADVWTAGSYGGGFGGDLDFTIGGRYGDFSALAALRVNRMDRSGLLLPLSSPRPRLPFGVSPDDAARNVILDSASIFTRLTYHIDDESDISLTAQLSAFDHNGDFADWVQLATRIDDAGRPRGSQISLARGYVNLSANLRVEERLQLTANAGFFGGEPTSRERIDVDSELSYVQRPIDFRSGLFDVGATWTPLDELRIVGGVDFLFDRETLPGTLWVLYSDVGEFRAGDILESISTRQGRRDFMNLGVFLLGTYTPIGRAEPEEGEDALMLRIDAGLRYDYNNIYGNQVNGRLGSSLRIIEELTVKVNYSSAFRAPTTQLLYGSPLVSGDIIGNEALRPQQIHTWEAIVSARPFEWLRAHTGLSYSYVVDKAEFAYEGVNSVARNLAELGVWSWETEVRVSWEEQLWIYANFALVEGVRDLREEGFRARLIGSDLEIYPPAIFNAGAGYRFQDIPLRLTVEARVLSDRRASDGNVVEHGAPYHLPAAFYLDVSIALVDVRLLPERSTTINFIVRNISDERAAHPGFSGVDYPSAPRTFLLQWQQEL
jgi:outer membrane receptor for ferrienterochelin and colicins